MPVPLLVECAYTKRPHKPANSDLGSLDIPEDKFEDDDKTVYTEYTPLGVCGGMCN